MHFTKDFQTDLQVILDVLRPDYKGPPVAFARFADGEADLMFARGHRAKADKWRWPAGLQHPLASALHEALTCDLPDYHVGVIGEETHAEEHRELLPMVKVPAEQVTFAELFYYANYRPFAQADKSHCTLVGPLNCHYEIPADAIMSGWDWRPLVETLVKSGKDGPILIAGGPLAKVIVQQYWLATEGAKEARRTILDVGSALNYAMQKRRVRAYQHRNRPEYRHVPRWAVL